MIIDNELNWKEQCALVYNKLLMNKHLLYLPKNLLNRKCMLNIYYAHIYSHLTYNLSIWGSRVLKKNIDKVFMQQKTCVRTIVGANMNAHTYPIFNELKIYKISEMINLELLKLGHKVAHNMLPKPIIQLFKGKHGSKTH